MKNLTKIILVALTFIVVDAKAQLNPLGSQFYQNQYLANPALAGTEQGFELGAAYKAQWTAIDGAPSMQGITGTYGSKNRKVGLGLNFYNESAGVIRRTSLKASYAYHLPLNSETSYLDLGLSAGFMDEWIDMNRVVGELTDQSLSNFNQRKIYLDGDFGIAYRNEKLTVQGVLPNLKRLMSRDIVRSVADRSIYMASISYKFELGNDATNIEPKVAYRGVQNYKDILDLGANLSFFKGQLMLNGVYHSTKSVTLGAGVVFKNKLSISCLYTTNTSDLQGYSNGENEIGIKYHF